MIGFTKEKEDEWANRVIKNGDLQKSVAIFREEAGSGSNFTGKLHFR